MDIKEIKETLTIAKAEVEWNYPLDYAIAIDEASLILSDVEAVQDVLKALNIQNAEDLKELLETHIPAEPKVEFAPIFGGTGKATHYLCPKCGNYVSPGHICQKCGQHIADVRVTDNTN